MDKVRADKISKVSMRSAQYVTQLYVKFTFYLALDKFLYFSLVLFLKKCYTFPVLSWERPIREMHTVWGLIIGFFSIFYIETMLTRLLPWRFVLSFYCFGITMIVKENVSGMHIREKAEVSCMNFVRKENPELTLWTFAVLSCMKCSILKLLHLAD